MFETLENLTAEDRKNRPMARGVLDYFPDALAEVALVSKTGNDQHNPGQPMHWAKEKSTDHADCIMRHLADRGLFDKDGMRHSAKVAWRALAMLQTELEAVHRERQHYNNCCYGEAPSYASIEETFDVAGPQTPGKSVDDV